ncbi:MAG: hypothetical protein JXR37_19290 [Kiritimatiellae bacterium]|nr:hypothetical protein [Kiritimatiellia bacterium]
MLHGFANSPAYSGKRLVRSLALQLRETGALEGERHREPPGAGCVPVFTPRRTERYLAGILACSLLLTTTAIADWKLPADHYVPAKMPPVIVYPRPDTETANWARHRKAYPGLRYEIPIGVQGGAWPFKYELVRNPSGMAIGQTYGDPNYGVVVWDDPAPGTHTVEARITDQDDTVTNVAWEIVVATDGFVFLDAVNGDNANPGTLNQPLKDTSGVLKDSAADRTYAGHLLYVRSGHHILKGIPANSGNVRMEGDNKPLVWLNYPGETPVFDCSGAKFFLAGNNHDLFFAGIRLEHGRQDVGNAHYFWVCQHQQRMTLWRNTFYDLGPGTAGTDNTSCFFRNNSGSEERYYAIIGNTYDTLAYAGNGVSCFDFYNVTYAIIEHNVLKNLSSRWALWNKYGGRYVTMRANTGLENNAPGGSLLCFANASSGIDMDYVEACWNNFRAGTRCIEFDVSGQGSATHWWCYRNTLQGHSRQILTGGGPVLWEQNVSVGGLSGGLDNGDNLIGDPADGMVDSAGRLQGTYRTQYLGRRGHEVRGNTADTVPPGDPTSLRVR